MRGITTPLYMAEVVVEGKILRWGNSYGVRIRKADLEGAGLEPGQEVVVRIGSQYDAVDVSGVRTFRSGETDTAARHDDVLGEARAGAHDEVLGEARARAQDEDAEDADGGT